MFLCVSSFYPQSLIPDIKPAVGQEAVVDLHPEEAVLSGAAGEDQECSDQNLQIRRTVTQVTLQPILPQNALNVESKGFFSQLMTS